MPKDNVLLYLYLKEKGVNKKKALLFAQNKTCHNNEDAIKNSGPSSFRQLKQIKSTEIETNIGYYKQYDLESASTLLNSAELRKFDEFEGQVNKNLTNYEKKSKANQASAQLRQYLDEINKKCSLPKKNLVKLHD